jgi:hypothetical protein
MAAVDDVTEFDTAMAATLDPQWQSPDQLGPHRVTGLRSWWCFARCRTCGHTFRPGDRVHVDDARREVSHLDPRLGCAGGTTAHQDDQDVREFLAGLAAAFPVVGDLPVVTTDDETRLLDPPIGGLGRMACLFCAHTFRPGESVIVCPCRPTARECKFAVHRDPGLGLVCWESWRPDGVLRVCPVTQRRLTD